MRPKPTRMGSREAALSIKRLLKERHAGDMFTEEALAGPGGAMRFDAWAMEPSWVNTVCSGYEVKVRRDDFIGDKKWTGYLQFCTEFYFACPAGLIQPEELPPQVGLLWATAGMGRLYQKKPAIPREIEAEALATMLRHVLMWRYHGRDVRGRLQAETWLRDMEEGREFDYKLKNAISKAAGRLTAETIERNKELQKSRETVLAVQDWLSRNGIDPESGEWAVIRRLEEAVRERREGITREALALVNDLRYLGGRLTDLAAKIEKPEA